MSENKKWYSEYSIARKGVVENAAFGFGHDNRFDDVGYDNRFDIALKDVEIVKKPDELEINLATSFFNYVGGKGNPFVRKGEIVGIASYLTKCGVVNNYIDDILVVFENNDIAVTYKIDGDIRHIFY